MFVDELARVYLIEARDAWMCEISLDIEDSERKGVKYIVGRRKHSIKTFWG